MGEVYRDRFGNKLFGHGNGFYAKNNRGKVLPKGVVPRMLKELSKEREKDIKRREKYEKRTGKSLCFGREIVLGKELDFGKGLNFGKPIDLGKELDLD